MNDRYQEVLFNEDGVVEASLTKWKVRPGCRVSPGNVLLLYNCNSEQQDNKEAPRKFKANVVGTVKQLLKNEGEPINEGCSLMTIELGCSHAVVMKDMCAECGADLRESKGDEMKLQSASVAMVHSVPELVVSHEQAQLLGKADEERLITNRKLVLLVDLDQTLVHTTNDDVPPNLKDVYHFQMYGTNSQWYHVRLRPGTTQFLESISKLYELHICTFGARLYAHIITKFLDEDGRYFSHRILSRDECFDPKTKFANLKALFPCGENLVCIIDDRGDVWNFSPNLVQVKPYHFFQHTGDINAPPGLAKTDNDSTNCYVGQMVAKAQQTEITEITKDSTTKSCKEYSAEDKDTNLIENGTKQTTDGPLYVDEASVESETQGSSEPEDVSSLKTVDDEDDYLLYLVEILTRIHTTFYQTLDEMRKTGGGTSSIPNLGTVIPHLRKTVLQGVNLVFSGVIPTNMPMEKSRVYHVAIALGASIHSRLVPPGPNVKNATTHVVAARLGTIKVIEAKKLPGVNIVTPDWLWCCFERWERVDERLFPLTKWTITSDQKTTRNPLPDMNQFTNPTANPFSTENRKFPAVEPTAFATYDPVTGKRINKTKTQNGGTRSTTSAMDSAPGPSNSTRHCPNGNGDNESPSATNFAKTINPIFAFSTQDLADMDREVEDILDESDSDTSVEENNSKTTNKTTALLKLDEQNSSESSSSAENISEDCPRGWKRRKEDEGESTNQTKYPRSELPVDSDRSANDTSDSCGESIGSVDEEMAAAVEREFLGL